MLSIVRSLVVILLPMSLIMGMVTLLWLPCLVSLMNSFLSFSLGVVLEEFSQILNFLADSILLIFHRICGRSTFHGIIHRVSGLHVSHLFSVIERPVIILHEIVVRFFVVLIDL
jgi:hypothetical protein